VTVAGGAEPLLSVRGLEVHFRGRHQVTHAVRGIDLDVSPGEVVGVVGESGSGKSASMLAVLGLLGAGADVSGSVRFEGQELIGLPPGRMRALRGRRIAMVFQDPMTSLNPVLTVGAQITEALGAHADVAKAVARRRAIELLELVSIPQADRRLRAYPHELSGGMRQRVMIAMAVANDPALLIADEPTTALDVTIQAQVLDVLATIRAEKDLAVVLITHDLGVVAGAADRVHVMYAGRVVERGDVVDIFHRPEHPYTRRLLACLPRLDRRGDALVPIGGSPPSLADLPSGCAFRPRCPDAFDRCVVDDPALLPGTATDAACHAVPARAVAVRSQR
jgi:oligopeptide/dipeptide ABC transporter ATP-binding protein